MCVLPLRTADFSFLGLLSIPANEDKENLSNKLLMVLCGKETGLPEACLFLSSQEFDLYYFSVLSCASFCTSGSGFFTTPIFNAAH